MTATTTEREWGLEVEAESAVAAKVYAEIEADYEAAKERAARYLAAYERVVSVTAPYMGTLVRASFYGKPFDVSWQRGQLPGLLVKCAACADLRAVVPLIRDFSAAGFHLLGTEEYAEIGRKTWEFAYEPKGKVVVQIMALLPYGEAAEGATCKVIETGEMVPVRKIVCMEDVTP